MQTTTIDIRSLLEMIRTMRTDEEITQARIWRDDMMQDAAPSVIDRIRVAWRERNAELLEEFRREGDDSLKILTAHGFVLDTTKWVTIKHYAEKHGLQMNTVTNWISRGIIPPDCVETLPELNDIRLVKDQPYK